jgi:hypothetical protein
MTVALSLPKITIYLQNDDLWHVCLHVLDPAHGETLVQTRTAPNSKRAFEIGANLLGTWEGRFL